MAINEPRTTLSLTSDELTLVRNGLADLIDRIDKWRKSRTFLFFRRAIPYEAHAQARINQITSLLQRLEKAQTVLETKEATHG